METFPPSPTSFEIFCGLVSFQTGHRLMNRNPATRTGNFSDFEAVSESLLQVLNEWKRVRKRKCG